MRVRNAIIAVIAVVASGCLGDSTTPETTGPHPPPAVTLLKDVVVSNLPSPYYHFEYDSVGKLKAVSFASAARTYAVKYDGLRLSELDNNTSTNHDRLVYVYDDTGRVSLVKYLDENGQVFTTVFLSYAGSKLIGLEREHRVTAGFILDKTMSFSYYPDGNVRDVTEHRPAIDSLQNETTVVDHYENYDERLNVDGFGLLHTDYFDHLVLLPGVRLQVNNPGRVSRTGDGTNYIVDYSYTYDSMGRPTMQAGDIQVLTGSDAGRRFLGLTQYSYY